MSDRTVHARATGVEVVRYDKGGKWYIEIAANFGRYGLAAERMHVGVHRAAEEARVLKARGGSIFLGLPGGKTFDRLVQS